MKKKEDSPQEETNSKEQLTDSSEKNSFKADQEISAIEAINWQIKNNLDCRPKIYDNKTKSHLLLDTGAMTSCWPKQSDSILDPLTSLKAANGRKMPTYLL